MIESYTLANGLQVLLAPTNAAPVVALQAWVNVGSVDEEEHEAGLAHFLEHMMFKGTSTRGVGQIAQEVEGVGGQINAWTSFQETTYHMVLPADAATTGLTILSDILRDSVFDEEERVKEAEVILEEIKQGEDIPSQKVAQALFDNAYSEHRCRRPIIGYAETVRGFSRDDLVRFYRKWYNPGNILLVVAGDFATASMKRRIRQRFGDWKGRNTRHIKQKEPAQTQLRLKTLREDTQESYLQMGFHTPSPLHEDTYALELLAVILGQGGSSRLYLELERNQQCVNGISAYVYSLNDRGLFLIGAPIPPGSEQQAMEGIFREIARIQAQPPSIEELEKARTAVESDAVYLRQSVQGLARTIGSYQTMAGDYTYEDRFYRGIAQVKREDITRVASQYLKLEQATICAMTPKDQEGEPFRLNRRSITSLFAKQQKACLMPVYDGNASQVMQAMLPNGVRLLLKEVHHAPMVSIRAAMLGGLRGETAKNNGISQVLAQLLTSGTKRYDAVHIAETVDRMAASLNGFAGRNSIGMQAEFLQRSATQGMELFAECMLRPSFPEEELERTRRLFLEEIRSQEDQLASKTFQIFSKALYPKHPYGLSALGSTESISSLTTQQVSRFYRKWLHPENLVISVVGDIDAPRTAEQLAHLFGELGGGSFKPPQPKVDPAPDAIRKVVFEKDRMQAHVLLGFLGTTLYDPDHYVFQVLNAVLAGQGGRLFMELRDRLSLAYSVSSSSLELLDPGCFAVYIATSPEKVDTAVNGILEQLDLMCRKRVPRAELKRVLRYLAGAHAISLQYNGAQAMSYTLNELYGLGFDYGERYQEAIQQVTAADIQRVAQTYFQFDKYVLAITRPPQ
jgi:zinc protease